MTRILSGLLLLFLAGASMGQSVPKSDDQPASLPPAITAAFDGPRSTVFESPKEGCNDNDIPDSMARAFRDFTGTVHLVAASSEMFQNLGPTLEDVHHICGVAFDSVGDPNPAQYNDQIWLSSFYTLDGVTVAALSHTEYHGWTHPGECNTQNIIQCEYDSDTFHLSKDGGYHFESFNTPKNFVAGVPYKYAIDDGPTGFSVDTDIIHYRGWYYAVATAWTWPPGCFGQTGPNPCLINGGAPIRTKDVFDPSSWRAWSGTNFSVTFVDPYLAPVSNPQEHVYAPVSYMPYIYALNIFRHEGADADTNDYRAADEFRRGDIVFATLWDVYDSNLGPEGLYFSTTTDLVHWTKPTLVVTLQDLLAHDPAGTFYAYFSVLDPNAPDRNFTITGDHAYLYYVRLNSNTNDRVLFRQPIRLRAADIEMFLPWQASRSPSVE
jgi:hypothetical protein